MNNPDKWYRRLGAFLISLGVFTAALFVVRFVFMRSTGFVVFLDDFLTMGLANVFLFPCGIWLFHIGRHRDTYVKVNRCPLALISLGPVSILILSLIFLVNDFTAFSITLPSFGEAYTLALYFSIIAACALSFLAGILLLFFQITQSKRAVLNSSL